MTRNLRPLCIVVVLLLTGGAQAQNKPVSGLSPRGAIASTDQFVNLPAGATTAEASTAADVQNYVLTSVKAYGAKGDGVTDDTSALQAAINSGQRLTCPIGIYKISATLDLTALANSGQKIEGVGSTGQGAGTANRCVIRPTSAVSTAFLIDGAPNSTYISSVAISGLTLDMTNMAAGSYGFKQGQSFDIHYTDVRSINDVGKHSFYMGPGAYVTHFDTVQGGAIECIGTGSNDPTTVTLTNTDINNLNATYCANVTAVGGAIQVKYTAGVTTVQYIAPGPTNLLNFYSTTALLNASAGLPSGQGIYVALVDYFSNMQALTSEGTDWEAGNALPATCSTGGTWAFGSYNDGTHGCLPMVWALAIQGNVLGCHFDNPTFGSEYLMEVPSSTYGCVVNGLNNGSTSANYSFAPTTIDAALMVGGGYATRFYSDDQLTQTGLIDSSNGALSFQSLALHPASAGDQTFCLFNGSSQCVIDMAQNGAGSIQLNYGSALYFNSGNETGNTLAITGAGAVNGYNASAVNTVSITPSTGKIASSAELYPGTGSALQTGGGLLAGAGNPGSGVGNNGDFYFRTDCTHGTTSCVWHKEAGAWVGIL